MHISLSQWQYLCYKLAIREYLDLNELQVETTSRCNDCLNCKNCTYQGRQMSLKEQFQYKVMKDDVRYHEAEKGKNCTYQGRQMSLKEQCQYKVMKDNIRYHEAEKVFHVNYPCVEYPTNLTYNIS